MESIALDRPVRILLLDNAWPYEVSGNVLRFSVLQQLLNEIQPCDNLDHALGPLEIFDLIIARDTPFVRRIIKAWDDPRTARQWLEFVYSSNGPASEEDDNRFTGWIPPEVTNSCQPELPLGSSGIAKIILQNPSTGALYRSYSPNDHPNIEVEMPPNFENSWAMAFGRGVNGLLCRETFPRMPFPLVVIAKEESNRLFSNKSLYIVEFNPFFHGGTHRDTDDFFNWFGQSRADEIYRAELAATSPGRRPTRRIPHPSYEKKYQSSKRIAKEFEVALQAVDKYHHDYLHSHLRLIEYHALSFPARMLCKSRTPKAVIALAQENSALPTLWNSLRKCAATFRSPLSKNIQNVERPMRLLAFDGGGVRGLSSLLVLQRILEDVKIQQGLSQAPLPCEYFDMIAGTSTGGLIAILLGRLRMPVVDCIKLYEEVAQEIFGEEQAVTSATRFSSTNFRQVLQKSIRRVLNIDHNEILLRDPSLLEGTGCPVFVVTIERDHVTDPDRAVLLRTYESKTGIINFEESCYLWEAALATCAAPIFFRPAQIKDKILVDGGLGHNNPSKHLVNEAEKRWPGRPIGALISIGTGKARSTRLAKEMRRANAGKHLRALMNMALVLKSIATSSEHRERSVYNYFRGMGKLDCYFRFNVDVGMEIELHEYKRYEEIRLDTKSYLEKSAIKDQIKVCAKRLEGQDSIPHHQLQSQHSGFRQKLADWSDDKIRLEVTEDLEQSIQARSDMRGAGSLLSPWRQL